MTSKAVAGVEAITKAYDFSGPALELGALKVDGTVDAAGKIRMPLSMLNRHGLVAGATGTGKTKTLQMIAEQLSANGIPCFLADIKGDLSGIAAEGKQSDRVDTLAKTIGDEWTPTAFPVEFLTIGGVGKGAALRVTMTSFGPDLLSKVLGLNEVQESSLSLIFHFADQAGLELIDLKDLRAVVQYLTSDEGADELKALGGLSKATAGVILRELITLSDQGADVFFGEPEYDTNDLLTVTPDGKGVVSVMELQGLQDRPALFSTFLMWLLADLFHDLPEIGDMDKPKLVFFFDEAHLLFDGASKSFLTSVAQTVRLIRSKGVGIYFVTQTPKDVPGDVLAQLGNRVQHALRAFTPDDAKALKATVSTFPKSDVYDLGELLPQLGIGEALVTVLSESGVPTPVAWTQLRPPRSLMAQMDPAAQDAMVAASAIATKYATAVDNESAFEKLAAKSAAAAPAAAPAAQTSAAPPAQSAPAEAEESSMGKKLSGFLKSPAGKSLQRQVTQMVGSEIKRSLFGTAKRRR